MRLALDGTPVVLDTFQLAEEYPVRSSAATSEAMVSGFVGSPHCLMASLVAGQAEFERDSACRHGAFAYFHTPLSRRRASSCVRLSLVSRSRRRTVLFELDSTFRVPNGACVLPWSARMALQMFDQL